MKQIYNALKSIFNRVLNIEENLIIKKTYTGSITCELANKAYYIQITTETPDGYELLCYSIQGNNWVSQIMTSIINSTNTRVAVNAISTSANVTTEITVVGLYKKIKN